MSGRTLLIALAALSVASASPAAPRSPQSVIAEQADRWNAANAAGDWAMLRSLYADDAWLMTDKAPAAKSADAIVAYLRRYREQGATVVFRFEPEDIHVEGRMAVMAPTSTAVDSSTATAFVASMSTGMPVWQALWLAEQAPAHFITAEGHSVAADAPQQ